MKRFPYLALLLVLLASCTAIPGLAPTATPVPSNTAEPTFTPLPTATYTPSPTSTPDKTATAAIQATESANGVLEELETVLDDSDIAYAAGHLAWQQTKPISIDMTGPDSGFTQIADDLTAGNFILKSDVTWNATGLLLCGAIFRSEPNLDKGRQYQFVFLRFSGLPAWAIEVHEYGQPQNSPTKTQFSGALDQGNDRTNQFVLIAREEQFNVYLNQVSQGRYFDYSKQRMDGAFGFLGYQQSGKGSCEFKNSWIWVLDEG